MGLKVGEFIKGIAGWCEVVSIDSIRSKYEIVMPKEGSKITEVCEFHLWDYMESLSMETIKRRSTKAVSFITVQGIVDYNAVSEAESINQHFKEWLA